MARTILTSNLWRYWQALFANHGFTAIDCLRPLIGRWQNIPYWYRHNLVLYARNDALDRLAPFARLFAMPSGRLLPDVSSPAYRLRKAVIRRLPAWICNILARRNARRMAKRQSPRGDARNSGASEKTGT